MLLDEIQRLIDAPSRDAGGNQHYNENDAANNPDGQEQQAEDEKHHHEHAVASHENTGAHNSA